LTLLIQNVVVCDYKKDMPSLSLFQTERQEIPLKVSQVGEGFFCFDFSFVAHYLSPELSPLRWLTKQVSEQFKS